MPNYALFMHGENFDIVYKNKKQLVGFFTTVRVEAESEEIAIDMAFHMIKSNPVLSEAYALGASCKPELEVKVVHVLNPDNKMKNTEYTFFAMDEV